MVEVVNGNAKVSASAIMPHGAIPVVTQESGPTIAGYVDGIEPIIDLPLVVFGDHTCTFKYVDFPFVRGADGTQLLKFDPKTIDAKFMCLYLRGCEIPKASSYERHMKYLKTMRISIPLLPDQKKIVAEVAKCEKEIATATAALTAATAKKSAILDKYLR